jgi:hypothetical protein
MLIGSTDKEGNTVSGKVLDKHQGRGRYEDLLLEIAKARVQRRTFDDAQQRRMLPGEKGQVKILIYCGTIEEFGIRPQDNDSPDAGQYFL